MVFYTPPDPDVKLTPLIEDLDARDCLGDEPCLLPFSSEDFSSVPDADFNESLAGVIKGIVGAVFVGGPHGGSAASSYDSNT